MTPELAADIVHLVDEFSPPVKFSPAGSAASAIEPELSGRYDQPVPAGDLAVAS